MIDIVRASNHALVAIAIAATPVLGGCDSFDQASTGCQIGLIQAFGGVVMSDAALASKKYFDASIDGGLPSVR